LKKFEDFKELERKVRQAEHSHTKHEYPEGGNDASLKIARDEFMVFGVTKIDPTSLFISMRRQHLQQFCNVIIYVNCVVCLMKRNTLAPCVNVCLCFQEMTGSYNDLTSESKKIIHRFFEVRTLLYHHVLIRLSVFFV
jgi:hypothetical protein